MTRRVNNAYLAGGLVALIAAGALFPLYYSRQGPTARTLASVSQRVSTVGSWDARAPR